MEQHQKLNFENEAYLVGSVFSSLTGYITPNLRAVCIEFFLRFNQKDFMNLLFYYDNPPSELERELADLTHTEFISLFICSKYDINFEILTLSANYPIPERGLLAYHRYEPG